MVCIANKKSIGIMIEAGKPLLVFGGDKFVVVAYEREKNSYRINDCNG